MKKGYADIVMEPFLARYEEIKYAYILEIKYIKSGVSPGEKKVRQLKSEAEEQLKNYSIDEKFKKTIEKITIIKIKQFPLKLGEILAKRTDGPSI